jgi:heterodisulfide reductase subunit A-like polyferredoxin
MIDTQRNGQLQGAVIVVGGGIAGMQAALDMANSGFYVYMVEKSPGIGGSWPSWIRPFPLMIVPCEFLPRNWSRSAGISISSCLR